MFHVRLHKLYDYYHSTKYGSSYEKETVDVLESLLKVIREDSYNDYGKFKGIYVLGSRFHNNLPPFSAESWQINNGLTMELMKRIVNHTGNIGPAITKIMMLTSETLIDKEDF